MKLRPKQIHATGGASANTAILQIMADVFRCPVARTEVAKSAALGAALRAVHGWLAHSGRKPRWQDVVAGFTDPIPGSQIRPNANSAKVYDKLVESYAACERDAIGRL
jgi:xylulokinase